MTEPRKTAITQEVKIDDLKDKLTAYKAAKEKAAQWADVADTFGREIEEAIVAQAGEWNSVEGKRTTYATVDGERVGSYTEYVGEEFDKKKARENHPEVIEAFTTKKQKKTFRIG